jgi:TctA family transporter
MSIFKALLMVMNGFPLLITNFKNTKVIVSISDRAFKLDDDFTKKSVTRGLSPLPNMCLKWLTT